VSVVNSGFDPIRASGDLEIEIGEYLLELLDKGEIKDPILVEQLMWYKAYNVLYDLEMIMIGD